MSTPIPTEIPPTPAAPEAQTPRTDAALAVTTTIALVGCADVFGKVQVVKADFARELERNLAAMTKERNELRAWKESALEVEKSWSCQAVAKLLGLPLGSDIRAGIEPGIMALQAKVERLLQVADHNWGEANYRLKYMDVIGRALGRPHIDGENAAQYASECAEIATALRLRLAAAEQDADALAGALEFCATSQAWQSCRQVAQDALAAHRARKEPATPVSP